MATDDCWQITLHQSETKTLLIDDLDLSTDRSDKNSALRPVIIALKNIEM